MDEKLDKLHYDTLEDDHLPLRNLNIQGDDIQKLSVIQGLPQLLQVDFQQTCSRIIPKILQELPNSSCEFHITASKVFRVLLERQIPVSLLHAVLQGIESRDPIVANSWMETLISSICYLSEVQVKNEIIPLCNCKSLLSQSTASRIASAKMLGRLAVHKSLDVNDVKRDVLPLAQSLCQDCYPDVRSVMCTQLPFIAQGLGGLLIKTNLLASLVELASDDSISVRAASVTAIVQLFPYISIEIKKGTILPLVKQLCEKGTKQEHIIVTTLALEIGSIVNGLQCTLSANDSLWFLNVYRKLAHRGLGIDADEFNIYDAPQIVLCRQHAASNLPSMTKFMFTMLPAQVEHLYMIFRDLAADPCYLVRRMVAGCIQEIVGIFGIQSNLLKSDFVRLIRDDSEDVLQMLVPQIGKTLEFFSQFGILLRQNSNAAALEIARALLKCELELTNGNNWRLLSNFLHQLEHLPNCMPPDFIHQHFTPVVLTCAVQGRAKPVRSQAVRTLLIFLRYNSKEMQRRWLRESMVTQLCRSHNCYTRHIYIHLCVNAIEIFSEKYFKDYFCDNLLDLAYDPVANIRLCVASLFAIVKRMIVMPEDKLLNERLTEIFKKYSHEETDRDVIDVFLCKMEEIKSRSNFINEEHNKEQKRRLSEEDRIQSGGKMMFPISEKRSANNRSVTLPPSISKGSSSSHVPLENRSNVQRSHSVPPRPGIIQNVPNDMSFLEQHFYIDAGVNLPVKSANGRPKGVVGKLTNGLSVVTDSWPSNITDDDKVNLRRLSDGSRTIAEKKNKRYSSVLSADCFDKSRIQKSLNRRSLNLMTKETSRIPVCNRNSPKKLPSSIVEVASSEQVPTKMPSYLPVLIKRSQSEVRK